MSVDAPAATPSQSPTAQSTPDPYRGVIIVLLVLAFLGMAGAVAGGLLLGTPLLLDAAVSLEIATAILIGVVLARSDRAVSRTQHEPVWRSAQPVRPGSSTDIGTPGVDEEEPWPLRWYTGLDRLRKLRIWACVAGVIGLSLAFPLGFASTSPAPLLAAVGGMLCIGAAGLAFIAARYLADIAPEQFLDAPGLCRGARLVGWILISAAAAIGLALVHQQTAIRVLHLVVSVVNGAVCYGLVAGTPLESGGRQAFLPDTPVLSLLGSRANIAASILDAAQGQLGIDLRSTWALTVVRRTVEPLIIGLCLLAWLSTCLTVVRVDEQGLVEHFGVPSPQGPLAPGLHWLWPWPIDRVVRIRVRHVRALTVGHGGQEQGGPENVLWAVQHAPHEYTLLLGNGRDLIAVDATVQYRITDARAWYYNCKNPANALRAIAYRAVMRSTVNRTLDEALSENIVALTARMRAMVQRDADALGLGVKVVAFTMGGMHPPVPVAPDYQAVVSAELGKVTAAVNAEAFRNQTLPAAEAAVVTDVDAAQADGAEALGRARGKAWGFRRLDAQYRAAPEDFRFRRRLETLEKVLAGKDFTIVDSRIQRDGGELWLIP